MAKMFFATCRLGEDNAVPVISVLALSGILIAMPNVRFRGEADIMRTLLNVC
jgi:hypothetical protein